MTTAESERGHEPTILPFTGPRIRQELLRNHELRQRIKEAGFVFDRYRSGPLWVGYVAVSKAEVLRRLEGYPVEAIHHLEPYRNGVILGA